jgi:hypothetical protein
VGKGNAGDDHGSETLSGLQPASAVDHYGVFSGSVVSKKFAL